VEKGALSAEVTLIPDYFRAPASSSPPGFSVLCSTCCVVLLETSDVFIWDLHPSFEFSFLSLGGGLGWRNLPQTWQVTVLMVGGREPGVPERARDLEPEDLGLGWWLVGS